MPLTTGITIRAYVITDEVYEHMVYAPDRLQKLADFLVNLYEDHLAKEAAEQACRKIFKTKSGKRICQQMFGLSL